MAHGWIRLVATAILILAVLLFVRLHRAAGVVSPEASRGHQLAATWCKECHAIDAASAPSAKPTAPEFQKIAELPSTTALSLKVFLQTNHTTMPNFIIAPGDADAIIQYILGLRHD
ncbi:MULTISPECIES: c-type cytochrome [Rhodopseudomonas]|uniref:Cytochrome C552 n=1 Tax=Rhodopseudomonas palustris TaxID=1076 RepID=A0A0D7F4A0_RHOPL|nr:MULTISPECIES: c-type cytochrome [Rhodopseudomonas]KIZ47914.1 cytochrome C552 [Rhodopseudomonas palustris]MDF3813627.1 cytochrome c [Rhodopseudomonas sp. BAL398]WOK17029.1 cytochrome c [Rhodopseudomonas sp. BAL398]